MYDFFSNFLLKMYIKMFFFGFGFWFPITTCNGYLTKRQLKVSRKCQLHFKSCVKQKNPIFLEQCSSTCKTHLHVHCSKLNWKECADLFVFIKIQRQNNVCFTNNDNFYQYNDYNIFLHFNKRNSVIPKPLNKISLFS